MLEEFNEQEGPDLERLCQGVSPNDEPCGYPATVHCPCGSPKLQLTVKSIT